MMTCFMLYPANPNPDVSSMGTDTRHRPCAQEHTAVTLAKAGIQ